MKNDINFSSQIQYKNSKHSYFSFNIARNSFKFFKRHVLDSSAHQETKYIRRNPICHKIHSIVLNIGSHFLPLNVNQKMRPYSTIKLLNEGKGVVQIDHYSWVFVVPDVFPHEYFLFYLSQEALVLYAKKHLILNSYNVHTKDRGYVQDWWLINRQFRNCQLWFFGVAVLALFWPTFLYNDVCLGFQQSAVLLDDFINTENDVWGNKRKSCFRLDEPDTREKKATLL